MALYVTLSRPQPGLYAVGIGPATLGLDRDGLAALASGLNVALQPAPERQVRDLPADLAMRRAWLAGLAVQGDAPVRAILRAVPRPDVLLALRFVGPDSPLAGRLRQNTSERAWHYLFDALGREPRDPVPVPRLDAALERIEAAVEGRPGPKAPVQPPPPTAPGPAGGPRGTVSVLRRTVSRQSQQVWSVAVDRVSIDLDLADAQTLLALAEGALAVPDPAVVTTPKLLGVWLGRLRDADDGTLQWLLAEVPRERLGAALRLARDDAPLLDRFYGHLPSLAARLLREAITEDLAGSSDDDSAEAAVTILRALGARQVETWGDYLDPAQAFVIFGRTGFDAPRYVPAADTPDPAGARVQPSRVHP